MSLLGLLLVSCSQPQPQPRTDTFQPTGTGTATSTLVDPDPDGDGFAADGDRAHMGHEERFQWNDVPCNAANETRGLLCTLRTED